MLRLFEFFKENCGAELARHEYDTSENYMGIDIVDILDMV